MDALTGAAPVLDVPDATVTVDHGKGGSDAVLGATGELRAILEERRAGGQGIEDVFAGADADHRHRLTVGGERGVCRQQELAGGGGERVAARRLDQHLHPVGQHPGPAIVSGDRRDDPRPRLEHGAIDEVDGGRLPLCRLAAEANEQRLGAEPHQDGRLAEFVERAGLHHGGHRLALGNDHRPVLHPEPPLGPRRAVGCRRPSGRRRAVATVTARRRDVVPGASGEKRQQRNRRDRDPSPDQQCGYLYTPSEWLENPWRAM